MARAGSVRNYAIEFVGGRRADGASIGGGNALLDAEQHALDGPEHTGKGDLHSAWTLVAGGSIAPTPGTTPTGEIVIQVKTGAGAPTHAATRGTLCLVAPDERVYINVDGATAWVGIGTTAEIPFDHGNLGATETIDVATNGTWHRGILDVACAITVTGFTVDEGLVAIVELTGTGAITWDADVDFGGADDQPSASGYTLFLLVSSAGDADIKGAKFGGGGLSDHTHAVTGSGATGGGGTLTPAVLTLPGASSPAQTAEGSAVWGTDDDVLTIGTGAARKTFGFLGTTVPGNTPGAPAAGTGNEVARATHDHGITASSGLGPLLLASDHAAPIVFDDILQASDGADFLYASEP